MMDRRPKLALNDKTSRKMEQISQTTGMQTQLNSEVEPMLCF